MTWIYLSLVLAIVIAHQAFQCIATTNPTATNNIPSEAINKLDDYISLSLCHFASEIKIAQVHLDEFREHFIKRVDAIAFQTDLAKAKFRSVDKQLHTMQFINELNRNCIRKYRQKITAISTDSEKLGSCIENGVNHLAKVISAPEATLKNLKNFQTNTLPTNLETCRKQYVKNLDKYRECVEKQIREAYNTVATLSRSFNNQMKDSECGADCFLREAIDCSYNATHTTVSVLDQTMNLIDNCVQTNMTCTRA